MQGTKLNPLTTAHCQDIDSVIMQYPNLRATLEAYERCGLNCQEDLTKLEAQYNICTALKAEFNPLAQ